MGGPKVTTRVLVRARQSVAEASAPMSRIRRCSRAGCEEGRNTGSLWKLGNTPN